ncbi:MAG: hypothetical protein A3D52_00035 [Candidatus Taylorbacteria bacterium RIFCSPHIGHO2_02_FULL_44_36]|nr:MAG: hypothetical protein A3D52_00035 [Candidatus Taylorbacteria bacterium RIFCSPHIGHO2_02_FULL_44_36]
MIVTHLVIDPVRSRSPLRALVSGGPRLPFYLCIFPLPRYLYLKPYFVFLLDFYGAIMVVFRAEIWGGVC